ncbi:MAG: alpha/beta fold hydrolase [Acidimicrobiales bacterium]
MSLDAAAASELFRRPPDRFVATAAGEVAYRVVGQGPDVLFVHGWPASSATFRALLPHLVEHVTCHLIDLPGAGSSRFDRSTTLTLDEHIRTVAGVFEALGLTRVAVVGHDSGGMIARHALAGDPRVSAMALIDTEQPQGSTWRFRAFLAGRHLPGYGAALGWIAGRHRLRRNGLLLGGAFRDRSLLDGEFDEFFLAPLRRSADHRWAAQQLVRSFRYELVRALGALHARIDVPVQLVWGEHDAFFPVERARAMVGTFADARLAVIAGAALFPHEERPEAVAAALLPVLTGRSSPS